MRISQFFVSWCTRARTATWSTPPCTPAPNCFALQLISSGRGHHCRMVPAARRRLQVILTQTGCHFSPKGVRLDGRKRCQNSGGKAIGLSMIRLQKDATPEPNFSRSTPVS